MSSSSTIGFREYAVRHIDLWAGNGVGAISIAVNLMLLMLAWLVFPLESGIFRHIRANKTRYFPKTDFTRPRICEFLRIAIQAVWIVLTVGIVRSAGYPRLKNLAGTVCRYVLRVLEHVSAINSAAGRKLEAVLSRAFDTGNGNPSGNGASGSKWLASIVAAAGCLLAAVCITQPFDVTGQVVFLSLMFIFMAVLASVRARISLMLLFVISIVVSARYLWWRCTGTIKATTTIEWVLSLALLAAEIYAFVVMVLGYFQVCWVLDRKKKPLPEDRSVWPTVDIFIPTYNEALEIIKPTVYAAKNLDWPKEKIKVWILDDGSRESFREFADAAGVGYIKRKEHNHAKAGNINHALTLTDGEYVVIFDCDHVPSSDFLVETVGWPVFDEKIALVQTPHHFYSRDPFEKNLHLEERLPNENSLFHDFIQKGNDTWNATMFCGSSAVMRRKALLEVGGIAVETVTEDAHTSLKLNRLGWKSAFIETPLASGLATDTLASHVGQRIRWARGMIQIFRMDNPLFGRGLTLAQRLCFFNAMVHFMHGLPRLIFLLAPLPYMFADIYVIWAGAAAIFAYVVPHMVHSAVTNKMLQNRYRYPFFGAVYETVLSWYILLPTTVALINPKLGKFNVTDKGGSIESKYFDWNIAKPLIKTCQSCHEPGQISLFALQQIHC